KFKFLSRKIDRTRYRCRLARCVLCDPGSREASLRTRTLTASAAGVCRCALLTRHSSPATPVSTTTSSAARTHATAPSRVKTYAPPAARSCVFAREGLLPSLREGELSQRVSALWMSKPQEKSHESRLCIGACEFVCACRSARDGRTTVRHHQRSKHS